MSPSEALQELREYIAQERDVDKLRALILEINRLLDLVEAQAAELESGQSPPN